METNIKYEKIETTYKSPLRIVEINLTSDQTKIKIDKHWHRSLEFIIPVENGSEVWVEGETYHAHPGSILLVNSRCIHECGSIHPDLPYRGYAIQLKYSFLKEVIPNIDNYKFNHFYDGESYPYLFGLLKKVVKAYKSTSTYQYLKLQSLAYELAYELVSHYCVSIEENNIHQTSKNKARLVDILSYLDKHASDPFDATIVADNFHISYGYLAKLFKNELGMTMKEYVNSVRVRNASFDLLGTDLSIVDIAIQHGFVSSKAFYKEFEKVYHMTPKQYRTIEKNNQ